MRRIELVAQQMTMHLVREAMCNQGMQASFRRVFLETLQISERIQPTSGNPASGRQYAEHPQHRVRNGRNTPGIEIGVDHSVSKCTSLYMRAGHKKNNGSATMSWPGISVTSTDAKQILAIVGVTHRF
ncbi:hypothetical protein [Paraburkholderia sp. BL6669N2]|uniref:hypothetical protein n=1 Tax=Paraburkholderia sp. BL6669N2 TaxID=1938807 RepID=UPI002161C8D7|nr:hypothetical protein [Paraburkholderia sp. BL6669N2]